MDYNGLAESRQVAVCTFGELELDLTSSRHAPRPLGRRSRGVLVEGSGKGVANEFMNGAYITTNMELQALVNIISYN